MNKNHSWLFLELNFSALFMHCLRLDYVRLALKTEAKITSFTIKKCLKV